MSTALTTLANKLAKRLDVEDGAELTNILKATAFKAKENVSDAQMTALMVVANEYGLNPFTKEIFAYPDKNNGIVPVVSVDGWSRIINERKELDGVEFRYSEATLQHKGKSAHEWIECVITRKDRKQPIIVREYFDEVVRSLSFPTPWDTHPKRMHRHKTLIQCARVAFGFSGIYDQDEAERIVEATVIDGAATVITGGTESDKKDTRETMTVTMLTDKFTKDRVDDTGVITRFSPKSMIERGEETSQNFIDYLGAKYILPQDVVDTINSWTTKGSEQ